VQLGTIVEYHWKFYDVEQAKKISVKDFEFIILTENDKEYVRQNILAKMFECDI
jgi:hypothetical protein